MTANPVIADDHVFISAAYYRVGSVLLRVLDRNNAVEKVWRGTAVEIHWTTPIHHGVFCTHFPAETNRTRVSAAWS